jgi:hypothetical protein
MGLTVTGAIFVGAGMAAAQTSTTSTLPPVRTIPVTSGTTATTTTAKATTTTAVGAKVASSNAMASTGIAADTLVPLGFALIGIGGVMHVASRRPQRNLGLL